MRAPIFTRVPPFQSWKVGLTPKLITRGVGLKFSHPTARSRKLRCSRAKNTFFHNLALLLVHPRSLLQLWSLIYITNDLSINTRVMTWTCGIVSKLRLRQASMKLETAVHGLGVTIYMLFVSESVACRRVVCFWFVFPITGFLSMSIRNRPWRISAQAAQHTSIIVEGHRGP